MKFIALMALGLSVQVLADDCIKNRAAFDIGSGSTKIKVAKVDTCRQVIIKMLEDQHLGVSYQDDILNNQAVISSQTLLQGVEAIKDLKKLAVKHEVEEFYAVATEAFRKAKNQDLVISTLSKTLGNQVIVINQETEAKLGFAAAAPLSATGIKNTVVWDIGGGSMQIAAYNGNGDMPMYLGDMAAKGFKKTVIEEILPPSIEKRETPNPIGQLNATNSMFWAMSYAYRDNIHPDIIDKIDAGATVIGIGGVHNFAVAPKASQNDKTYSRKDLLNAIYQYSTMDDQALGGGKYVDTDVTNLILVAGFMYAMGIEEVEVQKVNLADGLLVAPQLVY